MPVQIGQAPDSGFDHPIGLLSDCHRRIEKFLAALLQVATERRGGSLDDRDRDALEKSLRYFAKAAPWHTADEESSLFPRLRKLDDADTRQLLADVQRLEDDHRIAELQHAEVDNLTRQWLDAGTLPPEQTNRLLSLLNQLRIDYDKHLALEDTRVFPLAQRVLSTNQIQAMGREMAERRGVDPGLPPRRCKHGSAGANP